MARFCSWPRSRQVLRAIAAVGLVTGCLRLDGWLGTAGQVTAYAAVFLAFGVIALAAGVLGTYAEQRKANQQQAGQLARQRLADLAQVKVERFSGTGELLRIDAHRVCARACVRVVTNPHCRAPPGWKGSSAGGSRPSPRGRALSCWD